MKVNVHPNVDIKVLANAIVTLRENNLHVRSLSHLAVLALEILAQSAQTPVSDYNEALDIINECKGTTHGTKPVVVNIKGLFKGLDNKELKAMWNTPGFVQRFEETAKELFPETAGMEEEDSDG